MSFTVKPTRKNVQWIKKNIEKDAQKVESAALDRWTAEGGFVADETKAKLKKKCWFIVNIGRCLHNTVIDDGFGKKQPTCCQV